MSEHDPLKKYNDPKTRSEVISDLQKIAEDTFAKNPGAKEFKIRLGSDELIFKNPKFEIKNVLYLKSQTNSSNDSKWKELKEKFVEEKEYDGNNLVGGTTKEGIKVAFSTIVVKYEINNFMVFSEVNQTQSDINIKNCKDAVHEIKEYLKSIQ